MLAAPAIEAPQTLGFLLLPQRAIHEPLRVARDKFLPAVAPARGGLCVRDGFPADDHEALLHALCGAARPRPDMPALAADFSPPRGAELPRLADA